MDSSHRKPPERKLDIVYGMPHTEGDIRFRIIRTNEYEDWLERLQPKQRAIVQARIDRVAMGHFGDHKRFEELVELRWKNGTRVYAFFWGSTIVVALYGGSKNGQDRDIKKAKRIREEVLAGVRPVY